MDCVEDDKCEFKIAVEEDDAEVKWFKDGVEIIPDGKRYVEHVDVVAVSVAPLAVTEEHQSQVPLNAGGPHLVRDYLLLTHMCRSCAPFRGIDPSLSLKQYLKDKSLQLCLGSDGG